MWSPRASQLEMQEISTDVRQAEAAVHTQHVAVAIAVAIAVAVAACPSDVRVSIDAIRHLRGKSY